MKKKLIHRKQDKNQKKGVDVHSECIFNYSLKASKKYIYSAS